MKYQFGENEIIEINDKNLMGIIGGNRGKIHNNFAEKIVDIASVLEPDLVILTHIECCLPTDPRAVISQMSKQPKPLLQGVTRFPSMLSDQHCSD